MKGDYKGTLVGVSIGWLAGRVVGSVLGATLGRVYDSAKPQAGKDPYHVLKLDKSTPNEGVKRRYLVLSTQYHPDKVAHLGKELKDLAHRKFVEIGNAYEGIRRERGI